MDFFSLSLISILQWFEKLVYFSPENTRFKKQLNRDSWLSHRVEKFENEFAYWIRVNIPRTFIFPPWITVQKFRAADSTEPPRFNRALSRIKVKITPHLRLHLSLNSKP